MESNNLTLQDLYEKKKKDGLKQISNEINSISSLYFKQNKNPTIQLDVFNQYFNNQIKNYIQKGDDPYLNEEKNTSLPKFWEYTVGSLSTPVDIVVGEGPQQELIATVPPFLNPIPVKATIEKPTDQSLSNIVQEAVRDKDNNPYEFRKTLVTKLKPAVKDKIETHVSPKEHQMNWLNALDEVNSKNKSTVSTKPKKETKTEENNNEIVYQW